jgi:hypothetical protein
MAQPRRAVIVGSANPDWGRCHAEIVVDGAAAVEIRGTTATLRDVSGQQPQWRRFECTSALPLNPADVRFAVSRGRGRVEMIKDPRNGGFAVIRIEDPEGGQDVYAFELSWNSRPPVVVEQRPIEPGRGDGGRGWQGRYPRFNSDEAIHVCQDAIRSQASERFRGRPIEFRSASVDDNPGRGEWVTGRFAVRHYDGSEIFQFSCGLDYDGRRVREAHFDPIAGSSR